MPTFKPSAMIVIISVIVLAVIMFAYARRALPADEAAGQSFIGTQPQVASGEVLKIASFNIQTGKSNEGKRDIQRSAQAIAEVHFAGVQEVYAPTWFNQLGFGSSQSEILARAGSFNFSFNPTRKRWFRDHRGNAMFSRLRINAWYSKMLPDWSNKSFRNFTVAKTEWNDTQFAIINTHLHTKVGKEQQLELVIKEFDKYPRAILMGDFNTRRDSPVLAALLERQDTIDTIGELKLDPLEGDRIDWIITKGFKAVGGRFLPKGVSDHPYYEVHLQIDKI